MQPISPPPGSLILASGSPRRRELIALLGIPVQIIPSQAEEAAAGSGREQVAAISRIKCDDVFRRHPDRFVLGADTLVCVGDHILGKPKDEADAARMLRLLSGGWHDVFTGVCLQGPRGCLDLRVENTRVRFVPLSDEMIARYIRTGEPMDKAGAYAIQGVSGIFISRIEGSPSNVIGLPLALVSEMLTAAGFSPLGESGPS